MDTNNTYGCHGVMETVVFDNGPEFKNLSITDALGQLGCRIQWCEAGEPQQRGIVERVFRSLDTEFFHDLPGAVKGSIEDRRKNQDKESKSDKKTINGVAVEDLLTLEELRSLFKKHVVDIYHQEFHRGIDDRPASKWRKGVEEFPVNVAPSVHDLVILLPGCETRVIQRKGIEFKKNFYNSPELARVRDGENGKRVRIRYKDDDLSVIYVENPDTKQYFPVPSTNLAKTQGLSLEEQEREMAEANLCRREIESDPTLLRSKGEMSRERQKVCERAHKGARKQKASDPYGKVSPEVKIQEQNAAIPPSGPGFDDLETGSSVVSGAEFDGVSSNDNDLEAWKAERGRASRKTSGGRS